MLKFDLMDTVAGRQLYEMGQQKGSINNAQDMLLDALDVLFGLVPHKMVDQSPNIGSFKDCIWELCEFFVERHRYVEI